ncbi:MAG TPA: hypothetical protein VH415_06290 [Nitrososphaeraceae archaeon]|jgi:hypothetical protein
MGQDEYLESNHEGVKDKKKIDKAEVEQAHRADENNAFQIWRFTKGDIFAMIIGGVLGGIFSIIVIRLLGQ